VSFIAPEIVKGEKYSTKSDVWAIGMIYHQLLFGEPYFKGKNDYEIL
jgi:serine/threonine protein kinase